MMILRRALLYTIGVVLAILLVLLMLTPDKTYDGKYVNFYKYWTDNAYFNEVIGRI